MRVPPEPHERVQRELGCRAAIEAAAAQSRRSQGAVECNTGLGSVVAHASEHKHYRTHARWVWLRARVRTHVRTRASGDTRGDNRGDARSDAEVLQAHLAI